MSIREIYKYLNDNKIYPEDIREGYDDLHDTKYVVVGIRWGDWKHEHLRCNWLMEKVGFTSIGQVETEEDGSDCYCADHYYAVA